AWRRRPPWTPLVRSRLAAAAPSGERAAPAAPGEAQDWRRSTLLFGASRGRPHATILGIDRSCAMMRSLWISKTGMEAQQMQLDNISNNLANVSTNGYKG